MTVDPTPPAGAPLTLDITVDGSRIDNTIRVESIRTWHAVDEIPHAEIVMRSGTGRRGSDFAVSNKRTFLPGSDVVISAGHGSKINPIFTGRIARHAISLDPTNGPMLILHLVDVAVQLTLGRKNAIFEKMSDGEIATQLIEGSGLTADVSATRSTHEQVVQHYASDWDFLVARASRNGLFVTVDDGTVRVAPPDTKRKPDLKVTYGRSILDFDAELDGLSQLGGSAIRARAWEVAGQQVVEETAGPPSIEQAGNVSSKSLVTAFGTDPLIRQTGAPIGRESLGQWADATLQSSLLAKLQGTVTFPGSAAAKPATMIELAGLSGRFNGNVFISAVEHAIEAGDWTTRCEFGVPADWLAEEPEAAETDLLPPTRGLQIGIVGGIEQDPTGQFRIQVELPMLDSDSLVWVRLATFYATTGVGGAVFFPEIGDEVVVGFMDDDPRHGVILGSLYSATQSPKYQPDDSNPTKAIVSRSGLEIRLDDEHRVITLETPNGHRLVLDDDDQTVSIEDTNNNIVTLSDDGIKLESSGDIEIAAGGDIKIAAGGDIDVDAGTQVKVEGAAGAELSTSGLAVVKGALVEIN